MGRTRATDRVEFFRPDYARFSDLMRRQRPIAALSMETRGEPGRSARYREMIAPGGARDEMRVAWVDPFGIWGTCTLFAERPFDEPVLACLEQVRPAVTRSLRLARTREDTPSLTRRRPGVVVIEGRDQLRVSDAAAQRLLEQAQVAGRTGRDLADTLTILAALARHRDPAHPATARFRDRAGHWYTLDAMALDRDRENDVAVVVQPATTESVLGDLLRAFGLSDRERQVALLVAAGRRNRDIAAQLRLSPWTVQDHVKHVYAKTAVRSRGELAALVVRKATGR